MKRRAAIIVLIASVLLGVVTLVLWWESDHAARYVIFYWRWGEQTRSISVGIEPGQVAIVSGTKARNRQHGVTLLVRHGRVPDSMSWADERGQWEVLGFRYYNVTYTIYMVNPRHETIVDIPAWFFVVLFVCTGVAAVRWMTGLRRSKLNSAETIPAPGIPGEG